MSLYYKTFDGTAPIGRQNIYLCCCGEDVHHLSDITADIFSCRNARTCAVWYDNTPDKDSSTDELMRNLLNMHLIMLVVTDNLLKKYSDAFRHQLRIIREQNIPLLPLILSGCDIGEYRFKFDDYNDDSCLMTDSEVYLHDLDHRLKILLGGATVAQTIRDRHTPASIYISYPYRSGEHMRRLMTDIHNIDGLRDVSMHYSNLLLRSHYFDTRHARFIDKSDAYLMVVAPSVTGENYDAIKDSFSYAQRIGKPILPIEMVSTRRRRLERHFRRIPQCIQYDAPFELEDELRDALGRVSVDDSPEHRFYIGMAYLYGIDMEIDRDRAIQLITSAASDEYLPAVRQMVEMHSFGIGVDRDISVAAAWQKRAAKQLVSLYYHTKSNTDMLNMLEALNRLAHYYIRIALPTKARTLLERAKKHLLDIDAFLTQNPDALDRDKIIHEQALCRNRLGQVYIELGDNDAAKDALLSALDSYEAELRFGSTNFVMRSVASVHERLGKLHSLEDSTHNAELHYRSALSIRDMLASRTDSILHRRELAACYHSLAAVFDDKARRDECLRWELGILRKISEDTDSVQSRHDHASLLREMCGISLADKNTEEARKYGAAAVDMLMRLHNDLQSTSVAYELISACETLGEVYLLADLRLSARNYYMRALEIRRRFAKDDPENHKLQDAFAVSCYNTASLDCDQDDYRILMRTAAKIWEKLFYRTHLAPYREHALLARQALNPFEGNPNITRLEVVEVPRTRR
ncbi:MAG: sel1 repeat family protein [Clostridia bacterium]|nr:sel1 repeat family protein [Clostridia bacterium]